MRQYRKKYIEYVTTLESTHLPPPAPCDVTSVSSSIHSVGNELAVKRLVTLYHDECAFQSNDDQSYMWALEDQSCIRPKNRGSGLMVSDFIDEYNGCLRLTDEEYALAQVTHPNIQQVARTILRYGENRDGYWNSEKFILQFRSAVEIASVKYPISEYDILWIFDQSSNHTIKSNDALNANRMIVKPGGKNTPIMRDTVWEGQFFSMTNSSGVNIGLKECLVRRQRYTEGMLRKAMVKELSSHPDFSSEPSLVEKIARDAGHHCRFLPKFHCECNPIEQLWAEAKRETRRLCNYSITGLQANVEPALDAVPLDRIRKFFRKAREYLEIYRNGISAVNEVKEALKKYKSHR